VLVSARTRLTQRGGTLRLVVDSDRVLRTFRISSLIRVFPIHATLDDALSAAGRDRSAGGAEDGSFEAIRG
jgi:anti-sigma B factor antagonist